MVEYALIRSKRKTLAIYVKDGEVEVRAPLRMSRRDIDRFVAAKERWITDKLAKLRKQAEKREAFVLNYGDSIFYRGKEYPIAAQVGNRAGFDGTAFFMPPNLPSGQIKETCTRTYRRLARRCLNEKTLGFAAQMGVNPAAVRITGAKTRWGSCSSKKNISFSWRLIMAEDAVIDYVVVHELAHLKEMNHSAQFWAIVERVLPDFLKRKTRLKELQKRLAMEEWG